MKRHVECTVHACTDNAVHFGTVDYAGEPGKYTLDVQYCEDHAVTQTRVISDDSSLVLTLSPPVLNPGPSLGDVRNALDPCRCNVNHERQGSLLPGYVFYLTISDRFVLIDLSGKKANRYFNLIEVPGA